MLLSALFACITGPLPQTPDPVADTETGDPAPAWTAGPELPACEEQVGSGPLVALSGVLLAPEGPVAGTVVYDREIGRITCVGDCPLEDTTVVCTEGVVSPALIDAHNHLQHNLIGPWDHPGLYQDRYEWQSDSRYWAYRSSWDDLWDTGAYDCEVHKWAEARQLVSGVTSAVGGDLPSSGCQDTLLRNLDERLHELDYHMDYYSGRPAYLEHEDGEECLDDLSSGAIGAYVAHVAEGVSGSVRWEFDQMEEIGIYGPGVAYVHSTDASTGQLAWMASTGTGLVWSPRSNLDLYGRTTPVDVALRLGVPVALGPDWTLSGSAHLTQELGCARDWLEARDSDVTDVQLWDMVTGGAAQLLGLRGELGSLQVGAKADLSVFGWSNEPYRAVIEAPIDSVKLVIRSGEALFGEAERVDLLAARPDWCEAVSACGGDRKICVRSAEEGEGAQTLAELEVLLGDALADDLFPVFICEDERGTCADALPAPEGTDVDGDGIDAGDLCPTSYDPLQRDHDGDGVGDACDPCPLGEGDDCPHTPGDIDGDGLPDALDLCPWTADPEQLDADQDGKGDRCDLCPELSNPGGEICPPTLDALRNPAHPLHPPVGSAVTLAGLVVTGVGDSGFTVQDPDLDAWGGILVYTGDSPSVSVGDVVAVSGVYDEYYGTSEITEPSVTVTGSGGVTPIAVADACAIATDGADAERYESMLLSVGPVQVTDPNPDSPDDYNEWLVDHCLRIDDGLCSDCWNVQPDPETSYTEITGVLRYNYGNTKLSPRSSGDLSQ